MDIIYAHFYIPSYNYTILIWGHLVSGTLFTGFFAFPILIDYNEKGPPLQHSQFRIKRPGDRGGLSLTSLMSTKKDQKDNLSTATISEIKYPEIKADNYKQLL